jgi:hypothetical protein
MIEAIRANIFPTLLLLLDLFAAGEKLLRGDGWGAVYWVSAAFLTAAVIFGRGAA